MRYVDYKNAVRETLEAHPEGLTWAELRERAALPYERACPTWTRKLEEEIALTRVQGDGRAYVWRLKSSSES